MASQTCSIGFISGEFGGNGIVIMLFASRWFCVAAAECSRALSCWNIVNSKCHVMKGIATTSRNSFRYRAPSKLPSMNTKEVLQFADIPAHTKTLHRFVMQRSLKHSPRLRQILIRPSEPLIEDLHSSVNQIFFHSLRPKVERQFAKIDRIRICRSVSFCLFAGRRQRKSLRFQSPSDCIRRHVNNPSGRDRVFKWISSMCPANPPLVTCCGDFWSTRSILNRKSSAKGYRNK